ncbi:hypothetical protein DLM_2123 [Aquitalea magnusonii]|uniref:Uncharacterized protein n=1 Tax=Aquitalea magnusonii TaxID=332411 RepID=A0A3G9GD15_9NEIS|nr:hypothetical protein DLM_2123 [Aquitalea magnusonii]
MKLLSAAKKIAQHAWGKRTATASSSRHAGATRQQVSY